MVVRPRVTKAVGMELALLAVVVVAMAAMELEASLTMASLILTEGVSRYREYNSESYPFAVNEEVERLAWH
jgi:hypothetical protein